MYSSSVLVLALAVFGASAQSLAGCNGGLFGGVTTVNGPFLGGVTTCNGGLLGGVTGCNGGLIGGVTGCNGGLLGGVSTVNGVANLGAVASTPLLENVPLRLPSIIHPTTVQDSCNCIKTVVRPQLRKEVFTIPSVQRFFQTTSTPVVETVPYVSGSSVDVPTVAACGSSVGTVGTVGVESGLIGTGCTTGGIVTGGFGINGVASGF